MNSEKTAEQGSRPGGTGLRLTLQILLPVLVVAIALVTARQIIANIEQPTTQAPPRNIPLVRTITAVPESLRLDVQSHGTVQPRTSVTLSPQVSGRVTHVAEALRAGGFFAAGETLFSIDDTDYRLATVQRQADLARARLRLAQEKAEQALAIRAWRDLEGDRKPDELATRALQVKGAEADLAAAQAALERSRLDVQRTSVLLPFAGRVRRTSVDIGQQVTAGQAVAEVYGTDFAEVRLPIPDNQVAFLDLALGNSSDAATRPVVELTAQFAATEHRWLGVIERTEGEIDRKTRQLILVARIASPYASSSEHSNRPPLSVGLFVEAKIHGRTFDDVVRLPRAALRTDGSVLVVDRENRLRNRRVHVLRLDRHHVQITGGVDAGDRVCISAVETFVAGMPVQLLQDDQLTPAKPVDETPNRAPGDK